MTEQPTQHSAEQTVAGRGLAATAFHFIWALIVLMLAMIVGVVALMLMGGYWLGDELREGQNLEGDWGVVVNALSMLMGGSSFIVETWPILSPYPALLAAIIGEVARLRGLFYYLIAGGIAVAVLPLLATLPGTPLDAKMMAVFATAGFFGGFIYWLLAGRSA